MTGGELVAGANRPRLREAARPVPAVSRRFVGATVAVAGVAAVLVPDARPGINIWLLAAVAGAAVFSVRPRGLSASAWTYATLGMALAAAATFRDAGWVLAVDLLAAVALAGLAAADATGFRDVLLAPVGYLRRLSLVPRFLLSAAVPAEGLRLRERRWGPVARAGVLTAALVTVFGALFMAADDAFADLAGRVARFPDWRLDLWTARVVTFVVAALAVGALALVRLRPREEPFVPAPARAGASGRLGRLEWTTALVALDLLFAVFVGVQIAVLFGGNDHVLTTAGLTYAEYARQGFFQLLAVGFLTLAVVAGAVHFGRRDGVRDVRRLQLLGGTLCLLTLVILASSMHRLSLYEAAFGFTQLRLAVHAAIWWLGAVFLLVLAAGAVWRGRLLPRVVVAMTAAGLLALTALNPDALVAERNLDRFARTGRIDVDYLGRSMSADAVPALLRLPEPYRSCALAPIAARLAAEPDGWTELNLSRRDARTRLETIDTSRAEGCAAPEGT